MGCVGRDIRRFFSLVLDGLSLSLSWGRYDRQIPPPEVTIRR